MAQPAESSPTLPHGVQAEDAFFIVCQNNEKSTVRIIEASDAAAQLLGRMRSELEGVELKTILGAKAANAANEYLEYDDECDDVDIILNRVREFKLRNYHGEELLFAQKITREPARDHHQWFRLSIKDERRQLEEDSLSQVLRQNMAGVMSRDAQTDLPDRATCEQYLSIVQNYVNTRHLSAVFAVLKLDRHDKSMQRYGRDGCLDLLKHVGSSCRSKFREEDMVCQLSDGSLGLVLLDVSADMARVILNRLRWFIRTHRIAFGGKNDFSVTVSIVFSALSPDAYATLAECEEKAQAIPADDRNQLVEV